MNKMIESFVYLVDSGLLETFITVFIYSCLFVFFTCIVSLMIYDHDTQTKNVQTLTTENTNLKASVHDLNTKLHRQDTTIAALKAETQDLASEVTTLKQDNQSIKTQNILFTRAIFQSACQRAILLSVQTLYLHIGKQPIKPSKKPTFKTALTTNPAFATMLRNVFDAHTPGAQVALSNDFDLLANERNFVAHPCDLASISEESLELVETIDDFIKLGCKPSKSAATALLVLRRSGMIV